MYYDKTLFIQQTIPQMVETYQVEIEKIRRAYAMLDESQKVLRDSLGEYVRTMTHYHDPSSEFENVKKEIFIRAWKRFVERSEIRKVLSMAESKRLDEQLENGKDLPEITVENVFDTLKYLTGRGDEFAKEAIVEVFNILRPQPSYSKPYKTNKVAKIGKKVILTWQIQLGYGKNPFQVRYGSEDKLIAIDRVFHLLDGAGIPKGYKSPLVDTINTSQGEGETPYFKFSCYQNGNLHLTFKRLDLVNEINRISGDQSLPKNTML
jgi:hypothetical protein